MPPRRRTIASKTKKLTVCALLAALGVVFVGIGAVLEIVDITASMVASLVLLPILLCYGRGYTLMTFLVTGLLSVILMPHSLAPWMYVGLFGYYPMVKARLDQLPKILRIVLKMILLTVVLCLYVVALYFLTMAGSGTLEDALNAAFGESGGAWYVAAVTLGLAYLSFFCYDILIDKLLVVYRLKWQARVEKMMK